MREKVLAAVWLSAVLSTAAFISCNANRNEPLRVASAAAEAGEKLSPIQELGRRLFFEESLSFPPGQSCASCHDPKLAFASPVKELPVSRGAVAGRYGSRNDLVASYAAFVPPLHKDPAEGIWIGGLFWDGRVDSLAEQAKQPPLNPVEMAAPNPEALLSRLRGLEYAALFSDVFGADALDDPQRAFEHMARAIEAFERTKTFSPFSSRYDAYLAGQGKLSEQELRGLALFEDEKKGNCAACHPSRPGPDGRPPLFSDFSYDNLGVPKNPENPHYLLPRELNPAGLDFVDLGLGTTVKDAAENGKFRVPTLRNASLTGPYMHNGLFKTLFSVVAFYNSRDIAPWPPPEVKENVNREEMGNLKLTNAEMEDIVAFLHTLSDDWGK